MVWKESAGQTLNLESNGMRKGRSEEFHRLIVDNFMLVENFPEGELK